MTQQELFALAKSLGTVSYPFESDPETAVFRHGERGRWFGVWLNVPGRYFGGQGSEFALNLKCPPELSAMLRQNFAGILPAYHMNKAHWNTIVLDGTVPAADIQTMIGESYRLTLPKKAVR